MAERDTVLVDMDAVLADFDAEILERMAVRFPDIPLLTTREHFRIADDYPEHTIAIRALSRERGFFAVLPTMEDAHEGWQRLLELGYHPQICSSPIRDNPYSTAEKLVWLEQNFVPYFGQSVVDEAIITSDKHLCDGIALIDDRPRVKHASDAVWEHIIFDKEYNRSASGLRIATWRDPRLPGALAIAQALYDRTTARRER